jgi:1-acyl-sn-glycerol-3-phosphate acyltransferase
MTDANDTTDHIDPARAAAAIPAPRPRWVCRLRFGWLLAHLLAGVTVVALFFPLLSPARRNTLKARWSRHLLVIMGIELRLQGEVPDGCLLVANHVSWLDIYVINAARPTGFVAKSEVRHWPLIGWLAKESDTLFIERGSHRHAQHIAHEMARRLAAGQSLAVFPEGTTSDGREVQPFHAALLQAAVSAGRPVQALAIRYRDAAGHYTAAPAYIDEISFAESVFNTLAERGLVAELTVLPARPVSPDDSRRTLASAAESAIRQVVTAP